MCKYTYFIKQFEIRHSAALQFSNLKLYVVQDSMMEQLIFLVCMIQCVILKLLEMIHGYIL